VSTPSGDHFIIHPVPEYKTSYVLPVVIGGVVLVVAVLAIGEYGGLHETFFDAVERPIRHHEFLMEAAAVSVVGLMVTLLLRRILSGLRQLSSFITMCAWCRRVRLDGEWMSIEECLRRRDRTKTSLGLCPDCYRASAGTRVAL